ncbi:Uncharacterised protein [Enterobacter hormaechei]|nr:Uncharacterised protein [Enterobacter hormaechei]
MTEQSALTNETPHSTYDITGLLMPARAFFLLLLMSQVKMASWLGKYMLLILILTFQKWIYQRQRCFLKLIQSDMV